MLDRPTSAEAAMSSPLVRALLTDPARTHPYAKWSGAHWRLVSLVELGVDAGQPEALAVCDIALSHWATPQRLTQVPVVNGLCLTGRQRCRGGFRIGLADDPRVTVLVEQLLEWQWPDGGWNCDPRTEARRSSLHETLPPHRGAAAPPALLALRPAPGTSRPLPRRLRRRPRTVLARLFLSARRRKDGSWRAVRPWWRAPGATGSGVEAVDWADVAHQMVTLNALRVGASEPG